MVLLQAALQVTAKNTQEGKLLTVFGEWDRPVIHSPSDSRNSMEGVPKILFPHADLDLRKYMNMCFTLSMGVVPLICLP